MFDVVVYSLALLGMLTLSKYCDLLYRLLIALIFKKPMIRGQLELERDFLIEELSRAKLENARLREQLDHMNTRILDKVLELP